MIPVRLNAVEITDFIKKIARIKVFEHYISYKKFNGRTCLSPTRVEVGLPKISMLKILCTEMGN